MGEILIIYLDIDECTEGSSGCAQNCVNNYGSYKCKCRAGYSLKADGKTCSGCKKKNVHIYQEDLVIVTESLPFYSK